MHKLIKNGELLILKLLRGASSQQNLNYQPESQSG